MVAEGILPSLLTEPHPGVAERAIWWGAHLVLEAESHPRPPGLAFSGSPLPPVKNRHQQLLPSSATVSLLWCICVSVKMTKP